MDKMCSLLRMCCAACLLLLVLLPAVCRAEEAKGDPLKVIVAAMLEAYGGRDAVAGVTSVVAKGTISDLMKGREGLYARYFARPQKLRIEIMPEQGGEVRVLNGAGGWQGRPEALREARPVTIQSMIYQFAYLDLPTGLADNSYAATYAGKHDLRGREVDLLHIEVNGAPRLKVYVDPVKRLIVRVAADFSMGMGASELATEYEDFRLVGKILFPFRLVNYAGEKKISMLSLYNIQVNTAIPEAMFSPRSVQGGK